jgi:signal transduction histidine kinase
VARARLERLRDAALAIEAGLPLEPLLRRLVEQARESTRARYGALGVLDESGLGLARFVYSGMTPEVAKLIGRLPVGRGLLGEVTRSSAPIRIADVSRDPRFAGFPEHHPAMRTFLGVPLRIGDERFGNFYLAEKADGAEFTEEDERWMVLFSAQASLAVGYAREAERARRQQRLTDGVVRHAPSAILFFAPGGEVALCNPAAERLTGRPARGWRLDDWLVEWERPGGGRLAPDETAPSRTLSGDEVVEQEVRLRRGDGSLVPVLASAAPVSDDGRRLGTVVLLQDLTVAKQLERAREEFSACIAHDLRTPASTILMQTDFLARQAEEAGEAEVRVSVEALRRLQRCGRRLTQMVSDLVDVSRLGAQRLSIEPRLVELPRAIETLLAEIRPALGDHPFELRVEGAPPLVRVDPGRLDQILTNLLENAAKFSPGGAPVRVLVEPAAGGATISVSDEGTGIAPEELPRLYDRFHQAERTRRGKTGLGLGLSITRGLVEAHGGRISVESVVGRGSTFRVWLPDARPAAAA